MRTVFSVWVMVAVMCAACSSTTDTVPTPRRDAGNPGLFCTEACQLTGDCLSGYSCVQGQCVINNGAPQCRSTLECQARLAAWRADCQDDRGCPANSACVGDTSAGYCARKPTSLTPCTQTNQEEMTMQERDRSGNVTVCGIPRARCNQATGACFLGCNNDNDCGGELPHCNTQNGICECTVHSCHTNSSVCTAGVCRCAANADCTLNADHCYDGACGCTTAGVCTTQRAHPGTQWQCE